MWMSFIRISWAYAAVTTDPQISVALLKKFIYSSIKACLSQMTLQGSSPLRGDSVIQDFASCSSTISILWLPCLLPRISWRLLSNSFQKWHSSFLLIAYWSELVPTSSGTDSTQLGFRADWEVCSSKCSGRRGDLAIGEHSSVWHSNQLWNDLLKMQCDAM